jgi:hypothetical protein
MITSFPHDQVSAVCSLKTPFALQDIRAQIKRWGTVTTRFEYSMAP